MSRKRNVKNLKLEDFKGDPHAARKGGFMTHNISPFGWDFTAPAYRVAKAQSEKYRIKKK